ncbi:hydroxyacylglutathione hydrolase [Parvularcula sp. LCG005]|nr:hydroxyacylglutathione hydrolase [Parvularcula sp. LCG005]WOI52873.1 hydroxyacylglutathione hydrolase [Parvularcula sp. LCG005]
MKQVPCLHDNYGYLLRDEATGTVAAIDTPEVGPLVAALDELGWGLDYILNTHWHPDHVGGNETLKARYGATIIGPEGEADKIPGADRLVSEGDIVTLGERKARVVETPGHTLGHIVYLFGDEDVAFVGDTLFSLGCGRLFEGTAAQMWASLQKIRNWAPQTTIYCAHEYTAANYQFAASIDPNNAALQARGERIAELRSDGQPTVPMILADECRENPFLRADDAVLAANLGVADADPASVFAEIRGRKDRF